jgi:hypothetical protein
VSPNKFKLFLLAGQSNMAGRGEVTPADTIGNAHILRLNRDGEWEIAKDPIHFDKNVAELDGDSAETDHPFRRKVTRVFRIKLTTLIL